MKLLSRNCDCNRDIRLASVAASLPEKGSHHVFFGELIFNFDFRRRSNMLQSAAAGLGERQPRLRFAADRRALLEAVRSKPPGLVLAPFGDTPSDMARLAKELAALAPPVPLAAI